MFSSNDSLLMSSHLSRGLPTGLLPWNFPFHSRMIHSDYMTGPL
jgi:hypothetical protein